MLKMKQHLLFVLFGLLSVMPFFLCAQIESDTTGKAASEPLEIAPEFPGGVEALYKVIANNLEYPPEAQKNNIGGRVVVQFVIDTLGQPTKIVVLEGVSPDIDQEAMRLIGLLKDWKPGMYHGKKVRVQYWLPLTFYPDDTVIKRRKKRRSNR